MRIRALDHSFGCRVDDIDLRDQPDDATVLRLRESLDEHHLLIIEPSDSYDPTDQERWTRSFGPVELYDRVAHQVHGPAVLVLTNQPGHGHLNEAGAWHVDGSFRERPTYLTFLRMTVRPMRGASTDFVDLHDAYETLPARLREVVDERMVTQENGRRAPQVRIHPRIGRPALFVNAGYTRAVDGLGADDAHAYLRALEAHLCSREVYTHVWRDDDLVVVDNLSIAHRASPGDVVGTRTLHRTCVEGSMQLECCTSNQATP